MASDRLDYGDLSAAGLGRIPNRRRFMAKKKNGKGGKQTQIPGTERKDRIMEIETAASKYVEVRDERMALTTKESEAQETLLAAMKKHKLVNYICDTEDLDVEIVPEGEKAKVRRRKVEEADAA